jgi:hypothetical protein
LKKTKVCIKSESHPITHTKKFMNSIREEGDKQLLPSVTYHHLECFPPLPSTFKKLDDIFEHLHGWNGLDDELKSEFYATIAKNCFAEDHTPPHKGLSEMFPPFSEDHMVFEVVLLPRVTRGMALTLMTHDKELASRKRSGGKRKLSSSGVVSSASTKQACMPKSISKEISEES